MGAMATQADHDFIDKAMRDLGHGGDGKTDEELFRERFGPDYHPTDEAIAAFAEQPGAETTS